MSKILRDTLDFLRDLRTNNNKQWFEQNRARYEKARGHFEGFVTDLIFTMGTIEDLSGVTAKECIFRINRDIRFSPDKTPYKISMSAVLARGGRKPQGRAYYVHIEPNGKSLLAGGLHSPDSAQLEKVRRSIAENSQPLKEIIQRSKFVQYFGTMSGERLKTAPQGFPKDHPDLELLRLKQFLVEHALSDKQVLEPKLTTHILEVFTELKPFLSYFQAILDA